MTRTHLFFDLDGTLTDSKPGIMAGLRHSLDAMGIHEPQADLDFLIGPPLMDTFRQRYGLDQAMAHTAMNHYFEYYGQQGMYENAPYRGIPELLQALHASGRILCVATSKSENAARRILEHFGLAGYFRFIAGADYAENRMAKVDVLRRAVAHSGLEDPKACLMVGDREHDVKGAHALEMPCAGVLYGYGSEDELRGAGADYVVPDVVGLGRLLQA